MEIKTIIWSEEDIKKDLEEIKKERERDYTPEEEKKWLDLRQSQIQQVFITDNHKIPKKYRNGFIFLIDKENKEEYGECGGVDWKGKIPYLNIHPIKNDGGFSLSKPRKPMIYGGGKEEPEPFIYISYEGNYQEFYVKKSLVVECKRQPSFHSVPKTTDNTGKG